MSATKKNVHHLLNPSAGEAILTYRSSDNICFYHLRTVYETVCEKGGYSAHSYSNVGHKYRSAQQCIAMLLHDNIGYIVDIKERLSQRLGKVRAILVASTAMDTPHMVPMVWCPHLMVCD